MILAHGQEFDRGRIAARSKASGVDPLTNTGQILGEVHAAILGPRSARFTLEPARFKREGEDRNAVPEGRRGWRDGEPGTAS